MEVLGLIHLVNTWACVKQCDESPVRGYFRYDPSVREVCLYSRVIRYLGTRDMEENPHSPVALLSPPRTMNPVQPGKAPLVCVSTARSSLENPLVCPPAPLNAQASFHDSLQSKRPSQTNFVCHAMQLLCIGRRNRFPTHYSSQCGPERAG